MTACMGGFKCTRRDKCAHYHADSAEIAERLCQPGEANAFSPIKEVNPMKPHEAATAAVLSRVQADLDAVEAAMDDKGQTLPQMLARVGKGCESTMNRHLTQLREDGRAFPARVPKKMLGVGIFGITFVWFRTEAAANAKQEEARKFSEQCTLLRYQARSERNAKKRHENQKPLTVVGGQSKRKPTQKQADAAQQRERILSQEAANYRPKGDNTPAVPPPGVRIQDLGGFTGRNRYTVEGPVVGPFSSLKPGQYAFEAVSAAARAAA